ncbi:MAG: acyl-ACP--UDP-N-acetylglucosamine O-acyltransferase [Ignavibacteriaceae bacterium]|nr:acyl-ACP--UDP-N-acetylglucosamine O-acyltransferase [Ignavibacteriaceae bacterium]
MSNIHPTAIINPKAEIDSDVEIGPFCVIDEDVRILKGCKLYNNVSIYSHARIGENNIFYPGSVISALPQDIKFDGGFSEVIIGNNNTFRECVTVSRGTHATNKTVIENNSLFMAYAHVGHDGRIGNSCILANSVALGGHVHLEDYVILGGLVGIHQFVSVGKYTMIGAHSMIVKDVPPYTLFSGNPLCFEGLNVIGLKRRGFSAEAINTLKSIYTLLYSAGLNVSQAVDKIKNEFKVEKEVAEVISFIENSRRGLSK